MSHHTQHTHHHHSPAARSPPPFPSFLASPPPSSAMASYVTGMRGDASALVDVLVDLPAQPMELWTSVKAIVTDKGEYVTLKDANAGRVTIGVLFAVLVVFLLTRCLQHMYQAICNRVRSASNARRIRRVADKWRKHRETNTPLVCDETGLRNVQVEAARDKEEEHGDEEEEHEDEEEHHGDEGSRSGLRPARGRTARRSAPHADARQHTYEGASVL